MTPAKKKARVSKRRYSEQLKRFDYTRNGTLKAEQPIVSANSLQFCHHELEDRGN
jgi:hypothetical protein